MTPISLFDYKELAREKLPPMAFDYYDSGAQDEISLRDAYDRVKLMYGVLRDVGQRDLTQDLFGTRVSMPIPVAPTAFHAMAHPDGELATVRAAGTAGTIMIQSTLSSSSVEEVAAAAAGALWFQLYVYHQGARAGGEGGAGGPPGALGPGRGRRERGVRDVLGILRGELDLAMALCGCRTISEVTRDLGHIPAGCSSAV